MKIPRDWLQTFFDTPLPGAQELAEMLTFHAFEIESVENDVLDVKVTPNRGHDCLSVRGIAKELSAITRLPMKSDPLRQPLDLSPKTDGVRVTIDEPALCKRFTGAHITGVKVGPSPAYIQKALEEIGQRPINNIVDITNYMMFHLGQPLHAFDMAMLREKDRVRALRVRKAKAGETLVGLDEKKYELTETMLAIEDEYAGAAVSIAGVKGGLPTGIDIGTEEIFVEAANWDGVTIRKTSKALNLRTDASTRFEQGIAPEMAGYGLRAAVDLILEIAGGSLVGYVDEYPVAQEKRAVSVSVGHINTVLGGAFTDAEVADVFTRLDLSHVQTGEDFTAHVPFERLDLTIPEDLIEEVGRILGYEHVPARELAALAREPHVNADFARDERIRQFLIGEGFSEVYTSVFTTKGDRVVLNKVDGVKPYLRRDITESLQEALERNVRNKDLLGIRRVKLFEIGTMWQGGEELVDVALAVEHMKGEKTADEYRAMLREHLASADTASYSEMAGPATERYEPYSKYPFVVRDIALWVPQGTKADDVLAIIRDAAGMLLVRANLFDEFVKGDKVSYAFRLVFQSFDKTLTDGEVNERMESVNTAVQREGFTVR